ncbi:MAG: hypothetical protein KDA61_07785 [Planctomycetales bacterium]|nr:hypothetical protein [Planctomycetales bacterium]
MRFSATPYRILDAKRWETTARRARAPWKTSAQSQARRQRPPQVAVACRGLASALLLPLLCAWLTLCQSSLARSSEPTLLDNMDSPALALRLAEGRRPLAHDLVRGIGGHGVAAEHMVVHAQPGESELISYRLPRSTVIPELRLQAILRCNRPNARIGVRVELPRTRDADTHAPLTLLIRGEKAANQNVWSQLRIDNLPQAVERHARTARVRLDNAIDVREAVAVELVILAPGGVTPTEIWVDQIALYGVLAEARDEIIADPSVQLVAALQSSPQGREIPHPTPASVNVRPHARIARIIQWQGEPFALLQKLGFDTVSMARPPDDRQRAEAARLNLEIVCPPPAELLFEGPAAARPSDVVALGSADMTTPDEALGDGDAGHRDGVPAEKRDLSSRDNWSQIAAWDLGRAASPSDLAAADRMRRQLRRQVGEQNRPTILRPGSFPGEASRIADWLLMERPVAATQQTDGQYARELTQQLRLARPGTPVWMTLATHNSSASMSQLQSLRGGGAAMIPPRFDALLQSAFTAAAARPRGIYFESLLSLDRRDGATLQRSLALQLTNLRLGLIEPWLAGGKPTTPAKCSRRDLSASVLLAERSYLLLPLRWGDSEGAGVHTIDGVSFVLPGAAESAEAFLLTMTGAERLRTRRVAGGLSVAVDALPAEAVLLVTEDAAAAAQVEAYLRRHAKQSAVLRTQLVELRIQDAQHAWGLLPTDVASDALARQELHRSEVLVAEAKAALREDRYDKAHAAAAAADETLTRLLAYALYRMHAPLARGVLPIEPSWATMGDVALALAASRRTDVAWQPATGGSFEDLDGLRQAGWRRQESPNVRLASAVRLSPLAPRDGQYCLELEALPAPGADVPPPAPAPPIWVSSPYWTIPAGHLLEIRGVARNAAADLSDAAPLAIFDSLGGEDLALQVGGEPTWRPFHLMRAAQNDASTQVVLALRQAGRVQIDQVEIRVVPLAPQPHVTPVATARR